MILKCSYTVQGYYTAMNFFFFSDMKQGKELQSESRNSNFRYCKQAINITFCHWCSKIQMEVLCKDVWQQFSMSSINSWRVWFLIIILIKLFWSPCSFQTWDLENSRFFHHGSGCLLHFTFYQIFSCPLCIDYLDLHFKVVSILVFTPKLFSCLECSSHWCT